MFVNKRNGSRQEIDVSKIRSKIQFFSQYIYQLGKIDIETLTEQVKVGLHDGVSTSELDVYTARRCMELETTETQYGVLASRILINNHHKNTLTSFKDKMEKLYRRVDSSGKSHPFLNKNFYKFVCTNQRKIESMIDYQRDYLLDTFGFSTLEQQYINKIDGKYVERPQDLFMKEAICLCMNQDDFTDEKALEEIWLIYDLLSTKKFTYATPTLNNSGMLTQQLSSCFLLGTEDSLEKINKTLDDASKISKFGGGIGIHVSNLRSAGQLIRGTNGKSSGIVNFLRMYGATADAYNQGGKRKGSFAIFLRDYHPDFLDFIQLKNPIGDETQRARSLFLCVALSDMFWKAVENDAVWYFTDPEEYDGLDELYGEEFEAVMTQLIEKKKYKKAMKARDVLKEIMKQQFESGVPYVLNIDAVNRKNNLKHYSSIRSSNLCVTGDTLILTNEGHLPIRDIVENKLDVKVWTGDSFNVATFAKTGVNQKILKVYVDDLNFVKCTPYHKFFVVRNGKVIKIQANELRIHDVLMSIHYPVISKNSQERIDILHEETDLIKLKLVYQTLGVNPIHQNGKLTFPSEFGDGVSRITSIEYPSELEDTYCFNEPITSRGVFNGIVAGNCVEITLPSSSTEYGVCNLASIVLASYVTDTPSLGNIELLRKPVYERNKFQQNPIFDFKGLSKVVQILTRTMDRVIDRNAYPVKEAMLSNLLHRPIGIGCSGLADTCCLLRIPYDSQEGVKLSGHIAETIAYSSYSESSVLAKKLKEVDIDVEKITTDIFKIYEESKLYDTISTKMAKLARTTDMDVKEYNALEEERKKYSENPCIGILPLAKKLGVYPSYNYGEKAPLSRGEFQWKMWGLKKAELSGMWDWDTLESHIKRFGIRNSLLTAQMPTATTAQIMSVNEGVEPFTTNMYRRGVLSGEFIVFNKYLVQDLASLGLWNEDMKNYLIASGGSIQYIEGIPNELKQLYKTAWDMGQKIGVQHAVSRGPFLDHSQSFNVFIGNSTSQEQRAEKLYRTLFYGWKQGLKTGMYYLRTQPAIKAQQFSIPLESLAKVGEMKLNLSLVAVVEEEGCLLCGT